MNGLPIGCLPSCTLIVLLFSVFGSLAGYMVNDIVIHSVGFIGMYLLLKEYFMKESENQYMVVYLSLCFALVPFESLYGISVSGQPLLMYAFLNILNKKQKVLDYLFIAFFPFYSWLSMGGAFIVFALGVFLIIYTIKNRKFDYQSLIWIVILVISYFMTEYKLIYMTFFAKDFVSHRVAWSTIAPGATNFLLYIKDTLYLLLKTQYHTGSFKTYAIILSFIIACIIAWGKKRITPLLFWLPLTIGMICLIYGFYDFVVWSAGLGNFIPFLKIFQGERFYFLLPFLVLPQALHTLWTLKHLPNLSVWFAGPLLNYS